MNLTAFAERHNNPVHIVQLRSLLAEFTGSFLLAFFALSVGAIFLAQDVFLNHALVCLSIGMITFLATFFLYGASGSHFNPAVSIGFFIANRISFGRFIAYACTHILGGILAAILVVFLFSDAADDSFLLLSEPAVLHNPQGLMLLSICQSVMMFIVLLLFLVLTYLNKNKLYVATAMAITVCIASFVSLSITDYPLNPALTIGDLLFFREHEIADAVIIWLSPFAGGCMAGIIYFITLIRPA